MAAAGPSKPIHLYTISAEGVVSNVDAEEQRNIADTCQTWRELERETVGLLLSSTATSDEGESVPEP